MKDKIYKLEPDEDKKNCNHINTIVNKIDFQPVVLYCLDCGMYTCPCCDHSWWEI